MDRAAVTAVDDFRSLDIELAQPGRGATPERFRALWDLAARSPALGRLADAPFDAMAILCEADREPPTPARFGVWAACGPDTEACRSRRLPIGLAQDGHRVEGGVGEPAQRGGSGCQVPQRPEPFGRRTSPRLGQFDVE